MERSQIDSETGGLHFQFQLDTHRHTTFGKSDDSYIQGGDTMIAIPLVSGKCSDPEITLPKPQREIPTQTFGARFRPDWPNFNLKTIPLIRRNASNHRNKKTT